MHNRPRDPLGDTSLHTVDGTNPAPVDRYIGYPIIYKVLYIPGGAGFLPPTVFCTYNPNNQDMFVMFTQVDAMQWYNGYASNGYIFDRHNHKQS